MLAHDYAIAIANEITGGKELPAVLSSLDRVLARKGHEKLRPRILGELARIFERRGTEEAVVIVGSEEDLKKLQDEIADAKKELGIEKGVETTVDASLIGGYVLRTKEQQIDRSYKRALINLYRSIITNR